MKKLIRKSILTTSLFLLIVLAFVYNFIFNPLYKALEETSLENFINITEASKISIEHMIEKEIENSKSISSRTMIKNKIIEYKEGLVSLEELKNYTQPKYNEGVQVLENLVYSARIVDKKTIASTGDLPLNIESIDQVSELVNRIIKDNDRIYLVVYSPIKSNIGMDMVVFDLSKSLSKMALDHMRIDIIKKDQKIQYQEKLTINPFVSEYHCADNMVYLNTFYELADDLFLSIGIPKDTLYDDFDTVTKKSFKNLMMVFLFSFISINIMIILIANKRITSLDRRKEKYKQDSYYDTLTGAYSRLFLNKWLKNNHNEKLDYAIVFIDLNNFKEINDQYGHSKGDKILREVVSAFKNEIRGNDFIVRFGGDEFIILLDSVSQHNTIQIIERINKSLRITFSYGIGELKNTGEFYHVLEEIDKEMYQMKEKTKQ